MSKEDKKKLLKKDVVYGKVLRSLGKWFWAIDAGLTGIFRTSTKRFETFQEALDDLSEFYKGLEN